MTSAKKGCLIVIGLMCAAALLIGGSIVIATRLPKPSPEPAAAATSGYAEKAGFLWNNDSKYNDSARAMIVESTLRKGGYRCDRVVSQAMREPGNWVFQCGPGYTYRFRFDERGNLVSAERF